MAGRNIKIELELPEFEKELNITVTLQRDGEVLSCTSSSTPKGVKSIPSDNVATTFKSSPIENESAMGWKQPIDPAPISIPTSFSGGNMMDINI